MTCRSFLNVIYTNKKHHTMKYIQILLTISALLLFNYTIHAQCWNLVWEEQFTGNALDLNTWEYQVGGGGWGNGELQYYTNGENVSVSNGTLKITARQDNANQYSGNDYTSSRIRSRFGADFRYGRMEASIKLPIGQGIWPAFWMMPSDKIYGTWPSSGEIDIMEYLGHQTTTVYGTCHYGNAPNDKSSSGTSTNLSDGTILADNFHTFSIEWEPGELRWYFNGVQYHQVNDTDPDFNTYNWPFDQRFHFILNIAVGGSWPGPPDGTTVFPQNMEVDWVRVHQLLPDVSITGPKLIEPTATGIYALPNIPGATYNWSVPAGAALLGGQNTHQIIVNWGTSSGGNITANMNTACGSQTYTLPIEVSPNLWLNYDFENGRAYWNTNEQNGGDADFYLTTSGEYNYQGTSMCATVQTLGSNAWDVQFYRPEVELTAGETYTISFWARTDWDGKDADIAFLDANDYSRYADTIFTLTTNWENYSYSFTAPATATSFFTFDLGDEVGTFCFDNFSFSRASVPPVTPTNLWLNYDFEDSLNYWSIWENPGADADFDLVTTEVYEGAASMCVTTLTLASNPWDIQLSHLQNVSINETYTLGFWAKADQNGRNISIAFINSTNYSSYTNVPFTLADTWTYYTLNFTAPETATALFNVDLGDELGVFCFDDFYLSTSGSSVNLLSNHGFENGTTDWLTGANNGANANFNLLMSNGDVYEGTTSLCATTLTLTNNDPWDIQVNRVQDLLADETYTLSFWAKADQTGKDIDIAFINANTYNAYFYPNFILTDTWANYTFSFTAPETTAGTFNIDLGDELGTFCFDDFYFAQSGVTSREPDVLLDANTITLLPNPTTSVFEIQGLISDYTIEILDVTGSVYQVLTASGSNLDIDISTLPSGMYFIAITNKQNGYVSLHKILKM